MKKCHFCTGTRCKKWRMETTTCAENRLPKVSNYEHQGDGTKPGKAEFAMPRGQALVGQSGRYSRKKTLSNNHSRPGAKKKVVTRIEMKKPSGVFANRRAETGVAKPKTRGYENRKAETRSRLQFKKAAFDQPDITSSTRPSPCGEPMPRSPNWERGGGELGPIGGARGEHEDT